MLDARPILILIVALAAPACATGRLAGPDDGCRYVRRLGSKIPRYECPGDPIAQACTAR